MKILDLILIVGIVIGSVALVQKRAALSGLNKELGRIEASVGDLVIKDEKQLHMVATKTESPWQWAWRVYLPDACSGTISHASGGGSGSHGFANMKQMTVARCSIGKTKSGTVGIYFRFAGGSSFSSFGNSDFFQFLQDNRQRLLVTEFASGKSETVPAGSQPVTLLKLEMDDQLAAEARTRFGEDPNVKPVIPVLLEVTLDLN